MSERRQLVPVTKPGLSRMTKAELAAEVKRAWQEAENWRQGTYESVESEDLNRYLRWEAEMKQGAAETKQREAEAWVLAVCYTLSVAHGPLEALRLKQTIEAVEAERDAALAEAARLKMALAQAQSKIETLLYPDDDEG